MSEAQEAAIRSIVKAYSSWANAVIDKDLLDALLEERDSLKVELEQARTAFLEIRDSRFVGHSPGCRAWSTPRGAKTFLCDCDYSERAPTEHAALKTALKSTQAELAEAKTEQERERQNSIRWHGKFCALESELAALKAQMETK